MYRASCLLTVMLKRAPRGPGVTLMRACQHPAPRPGYAVWSLYIPIWETETEGPCNVGPLGVSSTQNSFYSAYWSPKIQSWPDVAKARTLLLVFGLCSLLAHKSVWSSLRGKLRPGEEPWSFQVTGKSSLALGLSSALSLPTPTKFLRCFLMGTTGPVLSTKGASKSTVNLLLLPPGKRRRYSGSASPRETKKVYPFSGPKDSPLCFQSRSCEQFLAVRIEGAVNLPQPCCKMSPNCPPSCAKYLQ